MSDAIERTAVRVRWPESRDRYAVHEVADVKFDRDLGWSYRSSCGQVLLTAGGAMWTTRPLSCAVCRVAKG